MILLIGRLVREAVTNTSDDINNGDIGNLNDDNKGFFLNDKVIVLKIGMEYNSIPKMVSTEDLPSNSSMNCM